MTSLQGLSEQEVKLRRAQGKGNNVQIQTSRSYVRIIRENLFTFMNSVLFALGIVLVVLGRTGDALVSVGVVLLNGVVGVLQESRSKYQLDRINLLTRPTVTVVREGKKRTIDPTEIVLGDILLAEPGDQIVVDGRVVSEGRMDMDESLLTGESDLIPKRQGDPVYSGSFCVSGSTFYEAEKVGTESLANQLTLSARSFRQVLTPLQQEINLVIRLLLLLVGYLWGLLILTSIFHQASLVESAQMAVVIGGLVPNGFFLMITVAYALGAIRMVKTGALVQQMNAVESLSNVDVLCLDKTGTLTANQITLNSLHPLAATEAEMQNLLGTYVVSQSSGNRTSGAIAAAFPRSAQPIHQEVAFSSARKWSAVSFEQDFLEAASFKGRGSYVLGAPEMLRSAVEIGPELRLQINELAECGLRVLLFAYAADPAALYDDAGQPQLPPSLTPLGLITFRDELRPKALETLSGFRQAGIQLKIISGDNPRTVAALARQAGFGSEIGLISGPELEAMEPEPERLIQTVEQATIFGRITPQQKAQLVTLLRQQGHYVAMIGDGVNDVMSLKAAQLGISMQSGSAATRGVADMVLMNDSFAALLPAVQEGQRIINGMQDILRLFLTRIVYVSLLINSLSVMGIGFPFLPKSNSLLLFLTVGIPPLFMAVWARPGKSTRGLIRSVLHFVLPASITLFLVTTGVYVGYMFATSDQAIAQSALTTTAVLCGLLLICFVEPAVPFFVGGDKLSGDWRPSLLALVMLILYVLVLVVPGCRNFFELELLEARDYLLLSTIVIAWAFLLRSIWRQRIIDRFLNVDLSSLPRH